MAIKPILFSTLMVQAILDGRKTQTRRIVKYPKKITNPLIGFSAFTGNDLFEVRGVHENGQYGGSLFKLKYKKDDILWVRETWHPKRHNMPTGFKYEYKATAEEDGNPTDEPWKPSIFMPKEACRIWLKVTKVRVERLNDISEEDAMNEGVELNDQGWRCYSGGGMKNTARQSFISLWNSINGKTFPWDSNPWVFVYEFERTDKPINF